MAHTFGTPEWAQALDERINGSSEYRNSASGWGKGWNGTLLLAFEPDAEMAEGKYLLLRLAEGRSSGVEFVGQPSHPDAAFALRGPFSLWKDILQGRTLAATAILTGKMKIEGDKMTLLRYTPAHRALVHCVSSIDTEFPTRA